MQHNSPYSNNFIQTLIETDLAKGMTGQVQTRFPPEPNGYLHIGHAKSICLNFTMAQIFAGRCNLRFDDTNPEKESEDYMQAIQADVEWLGFGWNDLCYASDYFEDLYKMAVQLIEKGLAYVDSQTAEAIRQGRGNLTQAGVNSPYRNRSVDENLALFDAMRAGQFADGKQVLRAKIDMSSANINLRDPVLYRIRHVAHYRAGDAWCIYPMYDFTHGLSDMLEGVTHSLCTLEFEDHRPLYDWFLDSLQTPCRPKQIEFSRLNLEYTVLSKRRLIQLVSEGHVKDWDDPRMPTLAGLRRRGVPAKAVRELCYQLGINKKEALIEMAFFENLIREELNNTAPRRMAVMQPLKLTICNYPEGQVERLSIRNHPQDESLGIREVPFAKTLYIEQDDFSENPPAGFKRLELGKEIRLRGAYVIRCDEVVRDANGQITELLCHYDPETLGKNPEGRKVKGVIHWVAAEQALSASINHYSALFSEKNPSAADDFLAGIAPNSHHQVRGVKLEPSLEKAKIGEVFQFERLGYFALDTGSQTNALLFNSTISLREGD